MRSAERRALILSKVQEQDFVSIEALARACRTSTQTIRRDISALTPMGQIERFHGGVTRPTPSLGNFAKRSETHVAEKMAAVDLLPAIIPDGSCLFLCGGSTMTLAAAALRVRSDLTIVTNNLHAAMALYDQAGFDVTVTGGLIRVASGSLVGKEATACVERISADYCVLSTAGITAEGAMLEFDQAVVEPFTIMLRNARKKILVADSSKFEGRGIVQCSFIGDMDYLLTDRCPPPKILKIAEKHKVQVRYPKMK